MLRSMTGYGRGEAANAHVTVVVELRSVNNRFRDLQLRCPKEYMPLEPRMTNVLKGPFHRGRIDAFVRRSVVGSVSRVLVDTDLAQEYMRAVQGLSTAVNGPQDPPFAFILGQPGVLEVVEAEVDVMVEWDVVETALEGAVDDLLSMRKAEGRALQDDLDGYLSELRTLLGEIEAVAVGINERLKQRLETRIRRLLGDRFDPYRITQEVALLADKADVNEEITRLRSHCDLFSRALDDDKPVGRRLDFLLQEMNREVNTIGSKASEHEISHRVVDMKTVLERMREQSANVE